jgi:RHS repeat-associated protein
LNRLTVAVDEQSSGEYKYRADGMRVQKVEGTVALPGGDEEEEQSMMMSSSSPTTLYRYDGQMCIEEERFSIQTDAVVRYGLGARGIDYIEKTTSQGTGVFFPIYDGHGNQIATLKRDSGSFWVDDRRTYDAWGSVRQGAQTGDPKGRYVANLGHVQDDESGLIYMRARYYEPSTGRFVSQDRTMEGFNWFVYCSNSPTNAVDYSGNAITWMSVGAGLLWYRGLGSFAAMAFLLVAAHYTTDPKLITANWIGAVNFAKDAVMWFTLALAGADGYNNQQIAFIAGLLHTGPINKIVTTIVAGIKAGNRTSASIAVAAVAMYMLIVLAALINTYEN